MKHGINFFLLFFIFSLSACSVDETVAPVQETEEETIQRIASSDLYKDYRKALHEFTLTSLTARRDWAAIHEQLRKQIRISQSYNSVDPNSFQKFENGKVYVEKYLTFFNLAERMDEVYDYSNKSKAFKIKVKALHPMEVSTDAMAKIISHHTSTIQ